MIFLYLLHHGTILASKWYADMHGDIENFMHLMQHAIETFVVHCQ
jgi:hypothetical protein